MIYTIAFITLGVLTIASCATTAIMFFMCNDQENRIKYLKNQLDVYEATIELQDLEINEQRVMLVASVHTAHPAPSPPSRIFAKTTMIDYWPN